MYALKVSARVVMAFYGASSQAPRLERLWLVHSLPHLLLLHPANGAADLLLLVGHPEGETSSSRTF